MKVRRIAFGSALASSIVLVVGSLAWACVFSTPPALTPTPNRAPVGSPVVVQGVNWATDGPIVLGLSADGDTNVQPLTTVTPASDGTFKAEVQVPAAHSGLYYLVATQGESIKNMPFEVLPGGNGAVVAQAPSALSASGDVWSGYSTSVEGAPELAVADQPGSGGSGLPVAGIALALGLAAVGSGVAVVELRRRHAAADRS